MKYSLSNWSRVLVVDTEFTTRSGELPVPICLVAKDLRSNEVHRVWLDQGPHSAPPELFDPHTLYIAYSATAELCCHLALGWPLPVFLLDLFVEFRCLTNGSAPLHGASLAAATMLYGLPRIDETNKSSMRLLAMRGGPWTAQERGALEAYCEDDVNATCQLLMAMCGQIDIGAALVRGEYQKAVARIEARGIPIDAPLYARMVEVWPQLIERLVQHTDKPYGLYEGTTFKSHRWLEFVARNSIPWPYANGRPRLDDDTFDMMSRSYPIVRPIRQLRQLLSKMRTPGLSIGRDGRNRTGVRSFGSVTGRNQPSNREHIFGGPSWQRGLITAPPGKALVYADYSQQEFGIAAVLSRDEAMQRAYQTGDPYLATAIEAGAIPPDATKATHSDVRDQFKAVVLGVQYGMGEQLLAQQLGVSTTRANQLLSLHRKAYPQFWKWSDEFCAERHYFGWMQTAFGWRLQITANTKPTTVNNWPMQSTGAEILRVLCIVAEQAGLHIVALVHDAVLVETDAGDVEETSRRLKAAMIEAGRLVLRGFELRVELRSLREGERLLEPKNQTMWDRMMRSLDELDPTPAGHVSPPHQTTSAEDTPAQSTYEDL